MKRLRVREKPRRARLSLRRLSFASGLVAAVAATALAMVLVYSDDHRLASQYRAALQGAHGQYFQSARLRAPGGGVAGTVFGYQGSPSWVFYVLNAQYRDGIYDEQIVTRTGRLVSLQPFRLVDGSWGVTTPIPLRDIARVRLVRRAGGPPLQAELPVVER